MLKRLIVALTFLAPLNLALAQPLQYNPALPAFVALQPVKWFWIDASGNPYVCLIYKVTPHSSVVGLVWYDYSGGEHNVPFADHISKSPSGGWAETNSSTGYVPTN